MIIRMNGDYGNYKKKYVSINSKITKKLRHTEMLGIDM
jgi:hypothetical protein